VIVFSIALAAYCYLRTAEGGNPPFIVVDVLGKGKGVLASRDIRVGSKSGVLFSSDVDIRSSKEN